MKASYFLNLVVMGTRLLNILNITHRSQRGHCVICECIQIKLSLDMHTIKNAHTHKIITQCTHVHSHTHTHAIYTLIQANSHMNAHKETEGSAVKRRKEGGKIEIYVSIVLVLR